MWGGVWYFMKAALLGLAIAFILFAAVYSENKLDQQFRMNNQSHILFTTPSATPYPSPVKKNG